MQNLMAADFINLVGSGLAQRQTVQLMYLLLVAICIVLCLSYNVLNLCMFSVEDKVQLSELCRQL
jgi:hypothetical protein